MPGAGDPPRPPCMSSAAGCGLGTFGSAGSACADSSVLIKPSRSAESRGLLDSADPGSPTQHDRSEGHERNEFRDVDPQFDHSA